MVPYFAWFLCVLNCGSWVLGSSLNLSLLSLYSHVFPANLFVYFYSLWFLPPMYILIFLLAICLVVHIVCLLCLIFNRWTTLSSELWHIFLIIVIIIIVNSDNCDNHFHCVSHKVSGPHHSRFLLPRLCSKLSLSFPHVSLPEIFHLRTSTDSSL